MLLSAEPLVVVLIGPGGVGKGTVAQRLLELDDHLWLSRSWTTRPQRATEKGTEYKFVDRAAFEAAIDDDRFLEWAEFHGNLYGTPLATAPDGDDVLLEIEVQGAAQVLEAYPDAVVILLLPPSMGQLEERLRRRGDEDQHVSMRLSSTPDELSKGQRLASFIVVNDEIERATGEILSILERLRQLRRHPS
ncbi:MAG: guanylate kinase [Acidobacteria bacterium]|nr:guanylate kinase [Acidobacteriota bacterium]